MRRGIPARKGPMREDVDATKAKILVAVRIRPPNEREEDMGMCVRTIERKLVVVNEAGKENDVLRQHRLVEKRYAFDYAFGEDSTQVEIYDLTTRFLLEGVLNGYNATVFAYGATGAGKTYTMIGQPKAPGIMVLTMQDMFGRITSGSLEGEHSYKVTFSYLEVYNETIRDLLHPSSDLLDLREDPVKGMCVAGIHEVEASTTEEVMELLRHGNKSRTQEATAANQVSSRSHAVLQVVVERTDRAPGAEVETLVGKLSLIDLAGSERGAKTQNRGQRMVEGANINRSLLALGNCINALGAPGYGKGASYVPYRDSRLTRLLKDSLGGNCRTTMIVNCSPAADSYEETINTLKYANRAKNIQHTLRANARTVSQHIAQYTEIIADLRGEVKRLRGQLQRGGGRGGVAAGPLPALGPGPDLRDVIILKQRELLLLGGGEDTEGLRAELGMLYQRLEAEDRANAAAAAAAFPAARGRSPPLVKLPQVIGGRPGGGGGAGGERRALAKPRGPRPLGEGRRSLVPGVERRPGLAERRAAAGGARGGGGGLNIEPIDVDSGGVRVRVPGAMYGNPSISPTAAARYARAPRRASAGGNGEVGQGPSGRVSAASRGAALPDINGPRRMSAGGGSAGGEGAEGDPRRRAAPRDRKALLGGLKARLNTRSSTSSQELPAIGGGGAAGAGVGAGAGAARSGASPVPAGGEGGGGEGGARGPLGAPVREKKGSRYPPVTTRGRPGGSYAERGVRASVSRGSSVAEGDVGGGAGVEGDPARGGVGGGVSGSQDKLQALRQSSRQGSFSRSSSKGSARGALSPRSNGATPPPPASAASQDSPKDAAAKGGGEGGSRRASRSGEPVSSRGPTPASSRGASRSGLGGGSSRASPQIAPVPAPALVAR